MSLREFVIPSATVPDRIYNHPGVWIGLCLTIYLFLAIPLFMSFVCRRRSGQRTARPGGGTYVVSARTQPAHRRTVRAKPTLGRREAVPDSSPHPLCSHSAYHLPRVPSPPLRLGRGPSSRPHSADRGLLSG